MRIDSVGRTLLVALGVAALPLHATAQSPEELFETRVRPLLAEKCFACHTTAALGGLRLDSREALLRGGDSGSAIVPGNPDDSLLISLLRHEEEDLRMPKDADRLTDREIEALVEWVGMDAPWPADSSMSVASVSTSRSPGVELFETHVRPLLRERCFTCHTERERGGLRLDSRERILQGGSRGPAIVPGNPEESLLLAAVRHEREDLQMPQAGARLTAEEIEGLVEWIRAGAEWPAATTVAMPPRRPITDDERAFWSFQPLAKPAVPIPSRAGWAKTDIDRFILAKLEEKNLTPLDAADRRQLIRRATFDLIGLPPTPEEVEAFVADESPDAFDKLVDRLLASPHYGERWGRHWLDVVRYGEDDTRGLAPGGDGKEDYASAYVYRDWVVESLNRDMPFDTFVKAQLAGDLLDESQRDKTIGGLGFLGGGPWYYDIAEPVTARADERHDRVDVTTRGFLGLTVQCARCHDHKYDPIPAYDYYALAGIFNNTNYHEYPLADDDEAEAYKKDKEYIDGLEKGLNDYLGTESKQLARVLTLQASKHMMAAWQVIGEPQIPEVRAAAGAKVDLELLQRWIRFLGKEPKHYPYLMDWQAMIARDGGTEEEAQKLADDFERLLLEIVAEKAKLEEKNRKIIAKGTPLEEVKSTPMPNGFESFFDQHQLELETMDREKLNLWADVFALDLDNELDTYFRQPGLLVFRRWGLERQLSRVAADHVAAVRAEIEEQRKELPDLPFVMGVTDKEEEDITDLALHVRGNPHVLGDKVPRRFLEVLSPEDAGRFTEGSGRLELAEAIASHPITARVIVNRVWRWHLGTGIVETPSNFGMTGERPTHPELLEYLSSWFVENGMSLKKLHREIMLSTVYQLGTGQVVDNEAIDGANRFYWRANRRRLEAEAIRDSLLQASGELDTEIGGPSLQLDDEKNNRRTIYSRVSRFRLADYLQVFDFPNPNITAEKRYTTNVPMQSLFFMNSDFVHGRAEALVRRLAEETSDVESQADGGSAPPEGNGDNTPGTPTGDGAQGGPRPSPRLGAVGRERIGSPAHLRRSGDDRQGLSAALWARRHGRRDGGRPRIPRRAAGQGPRRGAGRAASAGAGGRRSRAGAASRRRGDRSGRAVERNDRRRRRRRERGSNGRRTGHGLHRGRGGGGGCRRAGGVDAGVDPVRARPLQRQRVQVRRLGETRSHHVATRFGTPKFPTVWLRAPATADPPRSAPHNGGRVRDDGVRQPGRQVAGGSIDGSLLRPGWRAGEDPFRAAGEARDLPLHERRRLAGR